jgi:hypothetical protein
MENPNKTLPTKSAAFYLGIAEITLRNSRMTGLLGKCSAPKFRKIGRKVIYFKSDLDDWLLSLPVYSNTSEMN